MSRFSLYNDEQWWWLIHKHEEGYTYEQLSEFSGVHENTIRYAFYRRGAKREVKKLPPLETFRKEFLKLGGLYVD